MTPLFLGMMSTPNGHCGYLAQPERCAPDAQNRCTAAVFLS